MSISTGLPGAVHHLRQSQPTAAPGRDISRLPGDISEIRPSAVVPARAADADQPSVPRVRQSLEDINKVLTGFSISVQFQIDPDYKDLIVKVVDQDTGKLIRQIPTEDVVKMSKAMDSLKGLLFAQSV